ncbi:MAG: SurA N-terminal domain-containing protein [Christensenellales bacterium]|jgi:parvulin-like peptidyl-prolyl isomerase
MIKKITAFALALMMGCVLCSCSMVFVNEERDRAQVVAEVDEEKILKGEVMDSVNAMCYQYGITKDTYGDQYESQVQTIRDSILQEFVEYTLIMQHAKELNMPGLSDEDLKSIASDMKAVYDGAYSTAKAQVAQDAQAADSTDASEVTNDDPRVKEIVDELLTGVGYYNGSLEATLTRTKVKSNVKDFLSKDYNPTDSDVKEFYDAQLKEQKEVLDNSPSSITTYENSDTLIYVPKGIKYLKNLLIALPSDIQTQLSGYRSAGSDDEADKLRDAELKKIKEKTDEAYQAALKDFDAALEKYGEDPGIESYPEGYRIYKGISNYDSDFVDAGLALENIGDISKPTASDFGYFIIKYASQMQPGTTSFEDAKERLLENMKTQYREDTYSSAYNGWESSAKMTEYKDRF